MKLSLPLCHHPIFSLIRVSKMMIGIKFGKFLLAVIIMFFLQCHCHTVRRWTCSSSREIKRRELLWMVLSSGGVRGFFHPLTLIYQLCPLTQTIHYFFSLSFIHFVFQCTFSVVSLSILQTFLHFHISHLSGFRSALIYELSGLPKRCFHRMVFQDSVAKFIFCHTLFLLSF